MRRGGGGGSWFDHPYYTPLYKKGIKKIENKSMETTRPHIQTHTLLYMHMHMHHLEVMVTWAAGNCGRQATVGGRGGLACLSNTSNTP